MMGIRIILDPLINIHYSNAMTYSYFTYTLYMRLFGLFYGIAFPLHRAKAQSCYLRLICTYGFDEHAALDLL